MRSHIDIGQKQQEQRTEIMVDRINYQPSVITSEVYNEAETIFTLLENKEKLVSFLDCLTLLRGMGMNPTQEDMDYLRERMADPVLRLEQWRREEELKREKERRREEMRNKKRVSVFTQKKTRKSIVERAIEQAVSEGQVPQQPVKIVPVEEIKNIDWNIFISCVEEIYRDAVREEAELWGALNVINEEKKDVMTTDYLIQTVTTNGEAVLSPSEAQQLRSLLPMECGLKELAARLQGTYVAPTMEELERAASEEIERRRQQEAVAKAAENDGDLPLL